MTSTPFPVPDPRPDDTPWPQLRWPPPTDTVLLGRFVDLRPADPDRDAAELFAVLDSDAVWAHVRGRSSDAAAYAAALATQIADGRVPWVIRLRDPYRDQPAGAVIGTSSYLDVSALDARLEIGSSAYAPVLWGSGVNPDAKLALLRYAFDELGAGRVQLKTDVRNQRSQRAIAGIGARYEGALRRYQRRADDTVRDTALFSITVEDWPAVRATLEARVAAAE